MLLCVNQKLICRKLIFNNGYDKIVEFTEEEWNKMNLKNIDGLIIA